MLSGGLSTQEFMTYLTSSGAPRNIDTSCHAIAHIIGKVTFQRAMSIEEAMSKCNNSCGMGCIHGVIGGAVLRDLGETYSSEDIEHADAATIEKIGKKYCARGDPMCHAMGHILYMSTESYSGALSGCDMIASSRS